LPGFYFSGDFTPLLETITSYRGYISSYGDTVVRYPSDTQFNQIYKKIALSLTLKS
jgi:hypothetical protein